ncbi:hypothetical protein NGR_c14040 [Sinorhizobium fredii NGR234]|uniref:Uncharacterized protein n=1 Tax=Sinorhizobium fredii (strain NBRC 101917 / NGR234) TaxID=394 RepID=C3MCA4_SINFN|nr:hypothetical protein NGR_c14040 [Sinorhizobium fredii NGR234]
MNFHRRETVFLLPRPQAAGLSPAGSKQGRSMTYHASTLMMACVFIIASLASCTTITGSIESEPGSHQIAGHPYRTLNDCVRRGPVGRFDLKCDVPLLGYRNFSDPTIVPQSGAPGGFAFQ